MPERTTLLTGTGIAIPERQVASCEFDKELGLEIGTIERMCGVASRPVASAHETQEALASAAARLALAEAGVEGCEIDLLLFAAAVGRQPIPATAPLVKRELGLSDHAFAAYDINSTCLSALTAMDVGALHIAAGRARHVLVVASEIASRALPWRTAPATAGLFGDGAGALVLSASDAGRTGARLSGFAMETYPQGYDYCALRSGGTGIDFHRDREAFAANAWFEMDGHNLYRLSLQLLPAFVERVLANTGLTPGDLDVIVPHQASPLALKHAQARCGFRPGRVVNIVADMGNQVAASLPIALHMARTTGRIRAGMKVLLLGSSAGLSFGGAMLSA